MKDDPYATDLAEGPYRTATAASVRAILDRLEAGWAEEGAEHEKHGGGIYKGTAAGAGLLLYKLAMVQRALGDALWPAPPLFGHEPVHVNEPIHLNGSYKLLQGSDTDLTSHRIGPDIP